MEKDRRISEELADYHIHTAFCNHASGTMRDYVKHAISAGLSEMGFADHNPLPAKYNNPYRMHPEDLDLYFSIIDDLRQQYPGFKIKVGIELDYLESAIEFSNRFVTDNKFDYVIGSVHYHNSDASHRLTYLNDLNWEKISERFHWYFESMEKAIRSGLFDIIAHFDLPRRFWGDLDQTSQLYAIRVLELIKKYDLCLEINTSGFRTKNVEEPFPGNVLLSQAGEMEIPITLGSDSHFPHDVGSYFHEAVALLKKIGFKEISFFSNRKRYAKPI